MWSSPSEMVPGSRDKVITGKLHITFCDKRWMLIDGFYMPVDHFMPKAWMQQLNCLYKVLAKVMAVIFLSATGTSPISHIGNIWPIAYLSLF